MQLFHFSSQIYLTSTKGDWFLTAYIINHPYLKLFIWSNFVFLYTFSKFSAVLSGKKVSIEYLKPLADVTFSLNTWVLKLPFHFSNCLNHPFSINSIFSLGKIQTHSLSLQHHRHPKNKRLLLAPLSSASLIHTQCCLSFFDSGSLAFLHSLWLHRRTGQAACQS